MKLELKINTGENILLAAIKKSDNGNEKNAYQLVDELDYCWLKLEMNENTFIVIEQDPRVAENKDDLSIKLDQLVLDVIESEQSGTENTETKNTEEITPYDPEKIKVNAKQFSLKLVEEMIEYGDIDLAPDFQRNFVWNTVQKSRLIESILLRIPLPMFYFSEDEFGKISVVDGLQRLTTIKEFIDNKFPLKSLEYLAESCEGKYYSSRDQDGNPNGKTAIEPKYFRWFNMTQLSVNVIDPTSPPKVKYDIFRRINTGGKPLNNQEIRNCLASKELRFVLKQMASLPEFKSATDYSIKPTRMDDHEVALRFIFFWKIYNSSGNINNYSGYMDSSLDDLTEELARVKSSELDSYVARFSNSMKNAEYLLGSRYAFRKITPTDLKPNAYKQLINKALFVSISVLLANYEHERIVRMNSERQMLEPLAVEISSDRQLFNFLSYGTNSRANLIYAFTSISNIIERNIKY